MTPGRVYRFIEEKRLVLITAALIGVGVFGYLAYDKIKSKSADERIQSPSKIELITNQEN